VGIEDLGGFIAVLVWILIKIGGLGPPVWQPARLGWGLKFWKVFAPSLMGMIAFWSTLSLNIPDFNRFSRSQPSSPHVYIFTSLGCYGGLIAAVAGVLVAGYWVHQRTQLDLADLYGRTAGTGTTAAGT
jgi:cytosine/uracil/thiamine/allantoin permease